MNVDSIIKECQVKRTIILLLGLVLVMGCGGPESNVETEVEVPVSVEDIQLKPIEAYLTATGTVQAIKEATLRAEMTGLYRLAVNPRTGKPFMLGDRVDEGELIVRLTDPEYENNVALESKKLNLEVSKNEFEKQQSLHEKGGATLRELRNAELSYINARYSHDNALIQIGKMKTTAPFAGVIVELPYYTPDVRVASNSAMVRIMDYHRLYMETNLPSKEIGVVMEIEGKTVVMKGCVRWNIDPGAAKDKYSVDHSAGMYLLGPDGRYITKFAYASPPAEVAERIRLLMEERLLPPAGAKDSIIGQ